MFCGSLKNFCVDFRRVRYSLYTPNTRCLFSRLVFRFTKILAIYGEHSLSLYFLPGKKNKISLLLYILFFTELLRTFTKKACADYSLFAFQKSAKRFPHFQYLRFFQMIFYSFVFFISFASFVFIAY